MTEAIAPGGVIGILGGGQLGRMLAIAAARLGLKAHIYCPEGAPPAAEVADRFTQGAYEDADALSRFAASVDVITYEFENVPLSAARTCAAHAPVRPGARALEVAQDRMTEKTFLAGLGLSVAPFAPIDGPGDLEGALAATGVPAILKTRRFGYDGKGQARVMASAEAGTALAALNGAPAIAEGFVTFSKELSVIAARGLDGAIAAFDPGENVHKDGILDTTTVPGTITPGQRADAALIAGRILNALDYVGVIGVELFQTGQGLIVNEIAPRVHNSGHWTMEACAIDQFAQHIRAICGWPLGDGSRHSDAVMTNLIGADADDWPRHAADPNTGVHLYGKAEARPGRKMGHVTRITPR